MRARECPREPDVLSAMVRGRRDAVLEEHVAGCAACQELERVAEAMHEVAAVPVETGHLPDPSYVWWKAQLLRQWEASRRVSAPIETAHRVELVAAVVGFIVLLLWEGPAVLAWLTGSDRSALTTVAAPIAAQTVALFVVAGVIVSVTVALAFRFLLPDD
jgi:hypothetical protein